MKPRYLGDIISILAMASLAASFYVEQIADGTITTLGQVTFGCLVFVILVNMFDLARRIAARRRDANR